MDELESVFRGPMFYLLLVWGVVTVVFIALMIWRSLLSSHEDDQMFLDTADGQMAREQHELVHKIDALGRPLLTSGIASGVLLLVMVAMVVYHGLKSNF